MIDLPRQTRNHSIDEPEPLPDLSAMPDPRGLQANSLQADTSLDHLLAPGRDMLVNGPQPLPGVQPPSDAQQSADDFREFYSRLPFGLRAGIAEQGGLPSLATHFMQQRQTAAQQVRQAAEQQRQHDIGLLEKAMTNPRAQLMLEQLGESQGYSMAPQARSLAKAMKEGDYASFDAYKEVIPQDVQQRFVQGQLPHHELVAWLDHARDATKVNAKESAKALLVQRAMNKKAEERNPYENQLVEEHQAALELKRADIDLKKAQALKAQKDAEQGPHERDLGHDREAFTLQEFGQKYGRNVRFRDLAPAEQALVNRKVSGFQGEIAGARTTGGIEAKQAQEIGHEAVNWMDAQGNFPPPSMSVTDILHSGKYKPLAQGALNFTANANAAYQTIQQYRNVLEHVLVKSTGNAAMDLAAVSANRARLAALRRAGDEQVRMYDQLSVNAPLIARATGDTGNVALGERQILENYISDESKDTYESAMARLKQAETTLGNIMKSRNVPAPWASKSSTVKSALDKVLGK